MLKKFVLSFLASLILLTTLAPYFSPARAQIFGLPDTWYAPEFGSFVDRVYNEDNPEEIFGERYTHAQVVWILHSLTSVLLPEFILVCLTIDDPLDAGQCIAGILAAIPVFAYEQGGSNLASTLEHITANNQLSGAGYIRSLGERFHIVQEAQAQGFGFQNLAPVRTIWTGVRDISYFLLILAFIVMAFMIMFRVRISPQTVITVQSALPRLILILILITFSYAIAGFAVDLAYLSLGLVAILGSNSSGLDTLPLFNALITSLPIYAMFLIPMITVLFLFISGSISNPLIGAAALVLGIIFTILLFFVFLLIMLRVLWLMIKTFVNVVLLVIAGPILILAGVFPAAGGFTTWLRNLASHLAIFPLIISMVFVAHVVYWSSLDTSSDLGTLMSSIPMLNPYQISAPASPGTIELPGFNLGDSTIFGAVVALGILFLVPSVGGIVQGLLSGRPLAYGTAIGAAIGAGAGIATYLPRQVIGLEAEARRRAYVDLVSSTAQTGMERVRGRVRALISARGPSK